MKKTRVAGFYAVLAMIFWASNAFAINMSNAGWYLHLDAKQIQNGPMASIIKNEEKDVEEFIDMVLGHEFRKQIDQLTVYGDQAGYQDFTILLQGDFSKEAKTTLFSKFELGKDYSTQKVSGTVVHQWKFDGIDSEKMDQKAATENGNKNKNGKAPKIEINFDKGEKPLQLYAAEISKNLIIVSHDFDEVKQWLKGAYSAKQLKRDGIFSVVVHLDRSLAHGGMNFGPENIDLGFDSKIMKKVDQVSFSVTDVKEVFHLEVGLVGKDEKVAKQIKDLVNGLLALRAMAGDEIDNEAKALIDNLKIEMDGVNILLTSSIDKSELKTLIN